MTDQSPTDQLQPPFPFSLPGFGSRSEPDHDRQSLLNRPAPTMDSPELRGLCLELGLGSASYDGGGGDDFFIGRRRSTGLPGSESTIDFSRARPMDHDGLRVPEFASDDSDSDEQIVAIGDDSIYNDQGQIRGFDLNVPAFCWDDFNNFDWEEIDGRLAEERDVNGFNQEQDQPLAAVAAANVDWEVLLTSLENGDDAESEGFVYTNSDFEEVITFAQFQEEVNTFAQFQEHDGSLKGNPPAAKSAVESLPTFVLSKEDVENIISCAVCKDEIMVGEKAKRLPCLHCYHEDCILPWLEMRNTCPLCRYELPTDDPEYESWKARRAGNVIGRGLETRDDMHIMYGFETLPGNVRRGLESVDDMHIRF